MTPILTRRTFLAASATAAVLKSNTGKLRFGAPIFLKSSDPKELAHEHRRLGYSAAQCPQAKVDDTARIREIEKAFAAENVVIAEVGAWKNMMDPDPEKRKENMNYVIERMALAEAVGALNCVDIAGSYNTKYWFGPDPKNLSKEFFDATVENCRRVIDENKPKRSKFSIEMMGWSIPDGPDSYLKLIKAVDRKAFGAHVDVCNVINNPELFYHSGDFIRDCFRKLGPWIVSCHAKDLEWVVEMNIHFLEVVPGRGQVDYRAYLSELAKLPKETPLMMEHLKTPDEYLEGATYIRKVAGELGLSFA